MFCVKCQHNFPGECTCDDRDERLKAISEVLVYKKCKKCNKHSDLCKCENPEWIASNEESSIKVIHPGTKSVH